MHTHEANKIETRNDKKKEEIIMREKNPWKKKENIQMYSDEEKTKEKECA